MVSRNHSPVTLLPHYSLTPINQQNSTLLHSETAEHFGYNHMIRQVIIDAIQKQNKIIIQKQNKIIKRNYNTIAVEKNNVLYCSLLDPSLTSE